MTDVERDEVPTVLRRRDFRRSAPGDTSPFLVILPTGTEQSRCKTATTHANSTSSAAILGILIPFVSSDDIIILCSQEKPQIPRSEQPVVRCIRLESFIDGTHFFNSEKRNTTRGLREIGDLVSCLYWNLGSYGDNKM